MHISGYHHKIELVTEVQILDKRVKIKVRVPTLAFKIQSSVHILFVRCTFER